LTPIHHKFILGMTDTVTRGILSHSSSRTVARSLWCWR